MQIAILSDTHSRYATVEKVVSLLQERNVNFVVHCGDIEDADTVWLFHGFTTHFVLGNCDHLESLSLQQAVYGIGGELHRPFGRLELEGIPIAFVHGDDKSLMKEIEESGEFDFLFYGHTHKAREHRTGPTRVINPGALHRAEPKTFVLLNLPGGEVETVVVR
jgi:putative phosphoesterase